MKKFISRVAIFITVTVMAITFAFADDFNWVQWYEWNGIGSVVSMIDDGSMSIFEVCEKIIVPANKAGYVTQGQVDYLVEAYPEAEAYLITHQLPHPNPQLPLTPLRTATCINTPPQT